MLAIANTQICSTTVAFLKESATLVLLISAINKKIKALLSVRIASMSIKVKTKKSANLTSAIQ